MSVDAAVTGGLISFEGDLAQVIKYTDALNRFTEMRRSIPTEY